MFLYQTFFNVMPMKKFYYLLLSISVTSVFGFLYLVATQERNLAAPIVTTEITATSEQNADISEIPATSENQFLDESEPTRMIIPTLSFDEPITENLGLNDDKTIEVPQDYSAVGWYNLSQTPGERGPSIYLGHVSSKEGPEVFHELYKLNSGDEIVMEREDGIKAVYQVYDLESVPIDDFPTEKVYGKIKNSEIRLITCAGDYNDLTRRFSQNTIVYAALVDVIEPKS